MAIARILLTVSLLGSLTACTTATMAPQQSTAQPATPMTVPNGTQTTTSDAELQRLELSKWDPASAGRPEAFLALFADDFVSVEYGTDVQGGVHRRTRADVFSGPPTAPAKFELSDWRFVHADPHVYIVSYRVNGVSFPWQAYATSVWVQREGRWQTVFYQASTVEQAAQ
jgi:hypothetical protein